MSANGTEGQQDRRSQRTRHALRAAFNDLVLSRGYDTVSAAEVAARANVGRSTFYEHFRGKDGLLAESLLVVLEPLAEFCRSGASADGVGPVLAHLWQNRRMARALLAGPQRAAMARQLAALIAARLDVTQRRLGGDPAVPIALGSIALAHAQLAIIDEWLSGRTGWSPDQIIVSLRRAVDAYAPDGEPQNSWPTAPTPPAAPASTLPGRRS